MPDLLPRLWLILALSLDWNSVSAITSTNSAGDNYLGYGGAEAIAVALLENRTLSHLNLGCFPLYNSMIGQCLIGSEGTMALARALTKNRGLRVLIYCTSKESQCE